MVIVVRRGGAMGIGREGGRRGVRREAGTEGSETKFYVGLVLDFVKRRFSGCLTVGAS